MPNTTTWKFKILQQENMKKMKIQNWSVLSNFKSKYLPFLYFPQRYGTKWQKLKQETPKNDWLQFEWEPAIKL